MKINANSTLLELLKNGLSVKIRDGFSLKGDPDTNYIEVIVFSERSGVFILNEDGLNQAIKSLEKDYRDSHSDEISNIVSEFENKSYEEQAKLLNDIGIREVIVNDEMGGITCVDSTYLSEEDLSLSFDDYLDKTDIDTIFDIRNNYNLY